ncbi:MAG: nuclear transport factor 2 family protein [Beijerinckiaceae bacterium]
MTPLPEADAILRAELIEWLDTFAGYVRDVDYTSARPLFHPDILAFGTHRDVISGIDAWMTTQWDNVWPRTSDFHFDLSSVRILASEAGDMATVVAPWRSTGYSREGSAFDRPGRATMVFHRRDGQWICTHSHMSLNRGVPQESFAERPVTSRDARD